MLQVCADGDDRISVHRLLPVVGAFDLADVREPLGANGWNASQESQTKGPNTVR